MRVHPVSPRSPDEEILWDAHFCSYPAHVHGAARPFRQARRGPFQCGRSSAGRSSAGRSASSRPTGRRGGASERRGIASGVIRKRQAKQSGLQKAMGSLTSAVPGLGDKKKSSRSFGGGKKSSTSIAGGKSGTAGGVALLTAAAGFAFSNRDKVTSMLRRKGSDQGSTPQATTDVPPVSTDAATDSPTVPPHS